MSTILEITGLSKSFTASQDIPPVLDIQQLTVTDGEFISVIGPSGCGKSTLLKILAGLDTDYSGQVRLHDKPITGPSVEKGVIFQEHRLFPWLTVEENIAANLSLRQPGVRQRVQELIRLVKLTGVEQNYPRQLSGGMSQRVAIARALYRSPQVLLLDEPFGALDAFTRGHMQEALMDIWRANQTTMILVTHDIDEAVSLSNRIVVMDAKPGRIKDILNVDLPYPRKRTGRAVQEFRQLALRVLEHADQEPENWSI